MRRLHVVVALLLASLLQGCSSSSSPTNPEDFAIRRSHSGGTVRRAWSPAAIQSDRDVQ